MTSKSLRSEYINSMEYYEFTLDDLKLLLLYGSILGVVLFLIIRLCHRKSKAFTLLPIDKLSLKKAKESPFIGPNQTDITPVLTKLDDSVTTYRFRAPFKQEISLYEPDTRITITVENTMRT